MTQPTDDLAAQMVNEYYRYPSPTTVNALPWGEREQRLYDIARRYMKKAVATVSADAFHDGYHAGKIDALRQPEKGSTDE